MKKTLITIMALIFLNIPGMAQDELKFIISTSHGDITVKLYNDTPGHRDNFLKLVNEAYFDGSTFHRVINQFMIQGGGKQGGLSDVGYTIPAEILPNHYHKKGALAAARTGDNVNPQRASSGSQFYIVQGRTFSDAELDAISQRTGKVFTADEREAYKTVGGTPHLDGQYTVFGEVISGIDVIDKIATVKTGAADKPVEDVSMTIRLVK
jgi:cyclophilin family peptidyl-prolyl cis-trans isomerase